MTGIEKQRAASAAGKVKGKMERQSIMTGRDRMCSALEKYLTREAAIERANNIAMALTNPNADPGSAIVEGLRHSGMRGGDLDNATAELLAAWKNATAEVRRFAWPLDRSEPTECQICGGKETRGGAIKLTVERRGAERAMHVCASCAALIVNSYQIARGY